MILKTTPEYGTLRTRKIFLWLPKKFFIYEKKGIATEYRGSSETLWFETIEIDEEWYCHSYGDSSDYWQLKAYRRQKAEGTLANKEDE